MGRKNYSSYSFIPILLHQKNSVTDEGQKDPNEILTNSQMNIQWKAGWKQNVFNRLLSLIYLLMI